MKICIFGSHSFADSLVRGGTQYIAQALAADGHDVVYIAAPVSAAMSLMPHFRDRFRRARNPFVVAPHLIEYSPTTLFPGRVAAAADRVGLGGLLFTLNGWFEHTPSRKVEHTAFDICLCAAGGNLPFVHKVHAKRTIYRRNDVLGGLGPVPRSLTAAEWSLLKSGRVEFVSAVNDLLADEVRAMVPGIPVSVTPNGITGDLYAETAPDPELLPTRESNVLFIGSFSPWVDLELVAATARLLPQRSFHMYGPWQIDRPRDTPDNVHVHSAVSHVEAIAKMKACAVGIIPSGSANHGRMVVKPLKYYEYLAAGMGVASTSWGGSGVDFACIGDDAPSFAQAIIDAPAIAERHRQEIHEGVAAMDWRRIIPQILGIR